MTVSHFVKRHAFFLLPAIAILVGDIVFKCPTGTAVVVDCIGRHLAGPDRPFHSSVMLQRVPRAGWQSGLYCCSLLNFSNRYLLWLRPGCFQKARVGLTCRATCFPFFCSACVRPCLSPNLILVRRVLLSFIWGTIVLHGGNAMDLDHVAWWIWRGWRVGSLCGNSPCHHQD